METILYFHQLLPQGVVAALVILHITDQAVVLVVAAEET
jgi:hypothetical protein